MDARKVLMNIERAWSLPNDVALFEIQGQIGLRRFGLHDIQILGLFVLLIYWVLFLCFGVSR